MRIKKRPSGINARHLSRPTRRSRSFRKPHPSRPEDSHGERSFRTHFEAGIRSDPGEKSVACRADRGLSRDHQNFQSEDQRVDHGDAREQALAQAKDLEKEQMAGRLRGPLHGIPIGLKDNIDAAGVRTTAGSKTLEANVPIEDAEVTRRLRAAGAVLIGKCNMHIFAQGATSAVSYFGPVRNPWDLELIAGGSSGGSAAAVAMDNCYAALGTDTGGSIRTPSAMCGVVGMKGTYGRVSIRGIVPLTWSLDQCGPIARTVEDTALVLKQIAGYDLLDLQSIDYPVPDYRSGDRCAGIRNSASEFRRCFTTDSKMKSRR